MTDRELLEMAAKAAGINYTVSKHGVMMVAPTANPLARYCWNPLEDDGDALRLMVRLRLAVIVGARTVWVDPELAQIGHASVSQSLGDDFCAATRRAIVRSAAEIGRGR